MTLIIPLAGVLFTMNAICSQWDGQAMLEAENVIAKLKARFRVESDSDLAARLFVSRSTVANWRNRESVPSRYVRIAEGETNWAAFSRPPVETSNVELAALRLCASRLSVLCGTLVTLPQTIQCSWPEAEKPEPHSACTGRRLAKTLRRLWQTATAMTHSTSLRS